MEKKTLKQRHTKVIKMQFANMVRKETRSEKKDQDHIFMYFYYYVSALAVILIELAALLVSINTFICKKKKKIKTNRKS